MTPVSEQREPGKEGSDDKTFSSSDVYRAARGRGRHRRTFFCLFFRRRACVFAYPAYSLTCFPAEPEAGVLRGLIADSGVARHPAFTKKQGLGVVFLHVFTLLRVFRTERRGGWVHVLSGEHHLRMAAVLAQRPQAQVV